MTTVRFTKYCEITTFPKANGTKSKTFSMPSKKRNPTRRRHCSKKGRTGLSRIRNFLGRVPVSFEKLLVYDLAVSFRHPNWRHYDNCWGLYCPLSSPQSVVEGISPSEAGGALYRYRKPSSCDC